MSKIIFGLFCIVTTFILLAGCENQNKNNDTYTILEPVSFFQLTDQQIVDSLASILALEPFSYLGTTLPSQEGVSMGGLSWISSGKKYTNTEGQSIILWTDHADYTAYISYCHYRQAISGDWENIENEIDEMLNALFTNLGFTQKENEMFVIRKCAGGIRKIKWYESECTQTFHDDTLQYPYFTAEMEGDTGKINFMNIPVWYKNIDAISQKIPDEELKQRAKDYFIMLPEVLSLTDSIISEGYWIIENTLCKKFGSAILDMGNSVLDVFVDIQNGEIVEEDRVDIR